MKYIAPLANQMGISVEETAAAIGIMSDAGVKGSQAGTSLRGALSRLAKPTKAMRDEMKKLGVEFYNSDGTMKDLNEIVGVMEQAFEGLTEQEKQHALVTIFGQNALSGMAALINRGSGELKDMTTNFENCDGAAERMAETMLNNTSGAIEQLRGSLETAGIVIQQQLAPYIIALANKITELVNKFVNLDDRTKKIILAIAGVAAVIGPIILIVAKFITAISVISGALATITAGIASVTAGLSGFAAIAAVIATPVGAIVTAIAAVVAILAALKASGVDLGAVFQTIATALVTFFQEQVLPLITQIGIFVQNVMSTIIEALGQVWSVIQPIIQEFLDWFMEFYNTTLSSIITNFMSLITNLMELVNLVWVNVINPLIQFFVAHLLPKIQFVFNMISTILKAFLSTAGNIINGVMEVFNGLINFLLGVFTGDWERAWEGIKGIFKGIVDAIPNIFKAALNAMIDKINGFLNGLNGIKIPDWVPRSRRYEL